MRGDPQVSVSWTKDGVLLSKNNSLVIRQVTFKDKGNYECTAKYDYGKANSSFQMDVRGLEIIEIITTTEKWILPCMYGVTS